MFVSVLGQTAERRRRKIVGFRSRQTIGHWRLKTLLIRTFYIKNEPRFVKVSTSG